MENFPFDSNLLSCKNKGIFPDIALRLNKKRELFTGGELIELKDSVSYTISSFNSTIPTGKKAINKIISGENSRIKYQMMSTGNNIYSLSIRDVYYLVRGRKKGKTKICLVYGSFFETIKVNELISQSFSQVLEERLKEEGEEITENVRNILHSIFSQQENFSRVRNVEKAAVKLRFRIMTEIKAEGNILNSIKYPEIADDTLNFLLPCDSKKAEETILKKAGISFGKELLNSLKIFKIKHYFNGHFIVFQIKL
ncbi:MAG: hypothetical protein L6420_10680 [Elusimicrobia bacterium]|nr:hypothetical protein [Elusimicrobiota bacterium]